MLPRHPDLFESFSNSATSVRGRNLVEDNLADRCFSLSLGIGSTLLLPLADGEIKRVSCPQISPGQRFTTIFQLVFEA